MPDEQQPLASQDADVDFDEWLGEDELPLHWQDYVSCNPNILVGKPAITGTRLSVDYILELLASGWTVETILSDWTYLKRDQVLACIAYALDLVRKERTATKRRGGKPATAHG